MSIKSILKKLISYIPIIIPNGKDCFRVETDDEEFYVCRIKGGLYGFLEKNIDSYKTLDCQSNIPVIQASSSNCNTYISPPTGYWINKTDLGLAFRGIIRRYGHKVYLKANIKDSIKDIKAIMSTGKRYPHNSICGYVISGTDNKYILYFGYFDLYGQNRVSLYKHNSEKAMVYHFNLDTNVVELVSGGN